MSDYLEMIAPLGVTTLVSETLGSYQGDIVALVQEDVNYSDERFGFVSIGYGSCSGCDALEAAQSAAELAGIAKQTVDSIRWFDSLDEAKAFIASDDQLLQWHGHEAEWPTFQAAVAAWSPADDAEPLHVHAERVAEPAELTAAGPAALPSSARSTSPGGVR